MDTFSCHWSVYLLDYRLARHRVIASNTNTHTHTHEQLTVSLIVLRFFMLKFIISWVLKRDTHIERVEIVSVLFEYISINQLKLWWFCLFGQPRYNWYLWVFREIGYSYCVYTQPNSNHIHRTYMIAGVEVCLYCWKHIKCSLPSLMAVQNARLPAQQLSYACDGKSSTHLCKRADNWCVRQFWSEQLFVWNIESFGCWIGMRKYLNGTFTFVSMNQL